MILTDIDNFKKFNDFYGHQAEDYVLREFAGLYNGMIREYDLSARYGGEEIVFVLPETAIEEALIVAEKIRAEIEQHKFAYDGDDYRVTSSFGVAQFDGNDKDGRITKTILIERADQGPLQCQEKGTQSGRGLCGKDRLVQQSKVGCFGCLSNHRPDLFPHF